MIAWPDSERRMIAGYVRDLGMRTELAHTVYRQILDSFQTVVERHAIIDRSTLKAWLSERTRYWAPSTMDHHARVVDRFLSYLAGEAVIAANPIDVLRTDYQIRTRRSIWRALATTNPDAALAALRRPKPFGSVLGAMMRDHIALMRNRGYRYTTQATWCLRFDRHLQAHPDLASQPMEVMLESWRAARSTRNHAAECERLEGILAKALRHKDPALKTRRPNPKPLQEVARHWRRPHIYSPADVRRMLDLARSYPSPRAPLRPLTIYTMLLLAYCAGLRRSEIARLNLGDVELGACTITIRETKFFKTRILPLSESVMAELVAYMDARRRAGGSQDPGSGLFWHEQGNHRYTPTAVAWLLVDVLRRADLKPRRGKIGPRLHDLRHSMVVNRILEWYRAGINPQDRLPFLATYMGHRDIHSTLVYITVTQDLLQEASERFRVLGAPCLTLTQEGRP
jgi:integrase/recombinase XerD